MSALEITFIDTPERLLWCLEQLYRDLQRNPVVSCDFEGSSLGCSNGQLCMGQFATDRNVFLLDILVLGKAAFTTQFRHRQADSVISFKQLLESRRYTKLFFDPRADSLSLHHQFKIKMNNILCIQVMEVAKRRSMYQNVQFVNGLASVIKHSGIHHADIAHFLIAKHRGRTLFDHNSGVWMHRPISECLLDYGVMDVILLQSLYDQMRPCLNTSWMKRVKLESFRRARFFNMYKQSVYTGNAKAPHF